MPPLRSSRQTRQQTQSSESSLSSFPDLEGSTIVVQMPDSQPSSYSSDDNIDSEQEESSSSSNEQQPLNAEQNLACNESNSREASPLSDLPSNLSEPEWSEYEWEQELGDEEDGDDEGGGEEEDQNQSQANQPIQTPASAPAPAPAPAAIPFIDRDDSTLFEQFPNPASYPEMWSPTTVHKIWVRPDTKPFPAPPEKCISQPDLQEYLRKCQDEREAWDQKVKREIKRMYKEKERPGSVAWYAEFRWWEDIRKWEWCLVNELKANRRGMTRVDRELEKLQPWNGWK